MKGHAYFASIRGRSLLLLVALLVVAVVWSRITSRIDTFPVSVTEHVAGKVVLIDPGHGGADPGAVGVSGVLEKDVTLGIALHLERLLQRAAVHVVLTRRGDTDLADSGAKVRKGQDLSRRVGLGREAGADIFVSIHANSFPSPTWSGAQTFYFPGREADRWLAERIQERLVRQLGPNRRRAVSGDYYVLRESQMPAVVVEVGFLSNPRESELLGTPEYQRRVAEAIYMGIVDYFALPRPVAGPLDPPEPVHAVTATSELAADEVLLYFASETLGEPVAVVYRLPTERSSLTSEERVRLTLGALLRGPEPGSGLVSVIPEGVRIHALRLDGEELWVDFDPGLRDRFAGGAQEERLIVDTILFTVAQFPEVKQVRITVGGEAVPSIGGHVALSQPLPVSSGERP